MSKCNQGLSIQEWGDLAHKMNLSLSSAATSYSNRKPKSRKNPKLCGIQWIAISLNIKRWKIYRIRWQQTTGSWWEWQPVLLHPDSYSHWASISTAFTYPIKDSDNNSVSVGERWKNQGEKSSGELESLHSHKRTKSSLPWMPLNLT